MDLMHIINEESVEILESGVGVPFKGERGERNFK